MSLLVIETRSGRIAAKREAGLVLRPIRGEADALPIPLAVGRYVIGSDAAADVRLDVQGIDARHAVLLVGPQRSVLKAFSRFTWVNDGVVRECTVKPGDRICLGPVEFEVLKGKAKRRRERESTDSSRREPAVPPKPARLSLDNLPFLPQQALVTPDVEEASQRRRQVIAELNGELLSQLSEIVERETVASDRERRILEQSAQLEGRRRILEERHGDFERLRAELAGIEADWRRKSAELSEQTVQLKLERDALERERSRLAEEAARMASQSQSIDQRRESLDAREARIEEQRTSLELRTSQLNLQEQRHSAAVAQALVSSQKHAEDVQRLAAHKTSLQQQEEQLRLDREQLDRERAQYESNRDKLFAERAHLATREVEIAELRRQLHEREAELAARESDLQGQLDDAKSRHSVSEDVAAELGAREQTLAELETALALERQHLDDRKREIDEQHAAWMLERHTLAARATQEEREAEQAAGAEINMLRGQLVELQSRLREERGVWEQERMELASAAEAAQATPAVGRLPDEHFDAHAEIESLRMELESERARFEQQRSNWEAEQDLLLRDRQALEAEWRRLESRMEAFREPPAVHQETAVESSGPPPIPDQFIDHTETMDVPSWDRPVDAVAASWDEPTTADAASPVDTVYAQFDESEGDPQGEWSQAESDESGFVCEQYDSTEAAYGESAADESSEGPEADPDAEVPETHAFHQNAGGSGDVLSLRAQLAELFGIQSLGDHDHDATHGGDAESFDAPQDEQSPEGDLQGQDAFGEHQGLDPGMAEGDNEPDDFVEQPAQGFEEPQADEQQSDEDIMSAYLARLLKKSPEPQETVTTTISVAPQPAITEAADTTAETQEPEPQKPTRRLNAEEKETLRANMDSFRELANQQARAAVAKHKSNELKNGVQTVSVAAALIAVVGAILISAEFWTSQSYRIYGLACLGVSGALGIYTIINGMRIRRLKAVAQMTEALGGDEPEPEPIAEKPAV